MNDYKELIAELHKCKYSAPNTAKYAADAIEQLVRERGKLKLDLCEANDVIEFANDKLKRVERERDAAVRDLKSLAFCCKCKHNETTEGVNDICLYCREDDKWEWRGVQE